MNKSGAIAAVFIALAASACNSNSGNTNSPVSAIQPGEQKAARPSNEAIPLVSPSLPQYETPAPSEPEFEMPKVKYPAAIIFEGGKGNPWFDTEGNKHKAAWRLYLCLEKTDKPIAERVELDFSKLGNAIEVAWQDSATKKPVFTERLNKVVLNYTYTTELQDNPAANYGYAWGKAAVKIESEQSWELIFQAPDYNSGPHQPYMDLDFFNVNTTSGSVSQFGQFTYQLNGEQYYVSNGLDRFTFSEKDRRVHVIEACEREDRPYFFQIGDEITPIPN